MVARREHHQRPRHRSGEEEVYLCAAKNVWSNRIVGYSIDERMTSELAVSALRMAIQRRSPTGTTVHSYRGSQFRSRRFQAGATAGDRRLDRAEVSPATSPRHSWRLDAHRVRNQASRAAYTGGLNRTCHQFVPHARLRRALECAFITWFR